MPTTSSQRRERHRGGTPRRGRGRYLVVAAVAALAAVTAACGSATESSTSAAAGQADTAAAQQAIAPYVGRPGGFPVDAALGGTLPPGTRFAFMQCGVQSCAVAAQELQAAVEQLGGTLTVVNAGSTAATVQAAAASVLALRPDAVITAALDPTLYGGALRQMSEAGIKVVSVSVAQDVEQFGISFNYAGRPTFERSGRLMADWVVAKRGPDTDVVFYSVPEINYTPLMYEAFAAEVAALCPSCTVREVEVAAASLGTTAPRSVTTDLQAHPDTDAAVFSNGGLTAGLPAAMRAAGVSVTSLVYAPQAGTLQDIKNGDLTAGLGVDFPVSMWTAADAAARLVLGDEPTAGEQEGLAPLQFLEQQDITFDPAAGFTGYPDYRQRFAALWGGA